MTISTYCQPLYQLILFLLKYDRINYYTAYSVYIFYAPIYYPNSAHTTFLEFLFTYQSNQHHHCAAYGMLYETATLEF